MESPESTKYVRHIVSRYPLGSTNDVPHFIPAGELKDRSHFREHNSVSGADDNAGVGADSDAIGRYDVPAKIGSDPSLLSFDSLLKIATRNLKVASGGVPLHDLHYYAESKANASQKLRNDIDNYITKAQLERTHHVHQGDEPRGGMHEDIHSTGGTPTRDLLARGVIGRSNNQNTDGIRLRNDQVLPSGSKQQHITAFSQGSHGVGGTGGRSGLVTSRMMEDSNYYRKSIGQPGTRRPKQYDAAGQIEHSFYKAPLNADYVPMYLPGGKGVDPGLGGADMGGSVLGGDFSDRSIQANAAMEHMKYRQSVAYDTSNIIGERQVRNQKNNYSGKKIVEDGGRYSDDELDVVLDDIHTHRRGNSRGYGLAGRGYVNAAGVFVPTEADIQDNGSSAKQGSNYQYSYGTPSNTSRRRHRMRMRGRDEVLLE